MSDIADTLGARPGARPETSHEADVGDAGMSPAALVSGRDLRIMELVAQGCSNIEVGRRLGMSAQQVGRRIGAVRDQLDAPTTVAAVVQLVRRGLI